MFWWTDNSRLEKRDKGRTRDVSERGVFAFAANCPPPDAQIGFELFLPALSAYGPKTRVEGAGRVLRVEKTVRGRRAGFAVLTEHSLTRVDQYIQKSEETSRKNCN